VQKIERVKHLTAAHNIDRGTAPSKFVIPNSELFLTKPTNQSTTFSRKPSSSVSEKMSLLSFLLFLKHLDEKPNNHKGNVTIYENVDVEYVRKSRRGRARSEADHKSLLALSQVRLLRTDKNIRPVICVARKRFVANLQQRHVYNASNTGHYATSHLSV
jgi:hypothetical protein